MWSKPTGDPSIAVIIKTTPLRKSLLWLLHSADMSLQEVGYRFYIADEQPLDSWKHELYAELKNKGHYLRVYDKPAAVTVARNHLISQLQDEKYVLRVDDDFEMGGEFNIDALLTVLQQEEIDFCCDVERQIGEGKNISSGSIRIDCGLICFHHNKPPIIKRVADTEWKFKTTNNIRFAKADYMRNLILLKRYCFDRVQWNENLIFSGEHMDFYLSLKKLGFQGAFTPDSMHLHRDDLKLVFISKDDTNKRTQRKSNKKDVFNKDWGGMPVSKNSFVWRFNYLLKMLTKALH